MFKKVLVAIILIMATAGYSHAIDWDVAAPGEWKGHLVNYDDPSLKGRGESVVAECRNSPGFAGPQVLLNQSTEPINASFSWGGHGTLKPGKPVFTKGAPREVLVRELGKLNAPLSITLRGATSGRTETVNIPESLMFDGLFLVIK